MRKATMAVAALSTLVAGAVGGASPAAAYDYPYCLQGKGIGIPGECAYSSYGQCMTSAAGRGLYCSVNPRVAFAPQSRRGRLSDPYRDY